MRRSLALFALLCLLSAACGLKVPYDPATAGGSGITDADLASSTGANGSAGSGEAGGVGAADAALGQDPAAGGAAEQAKAQAKAAQSAVGVSSACNKPGLFPNECEGITPDQITICSHIPITGAAPIPRDPRRFGAFYFDYVNKELGGIHGRKVRWIAIDDQYNPTQAQAAFERCRSEGSFLFIGAAGTDQIVAVAKRANQLKLPYLHGPASVKDIGNLTYSKFIGPDYESQHRLLADYIVRNAQQISGKAKPKIGMVRVDSVFFDAGRDAFDDQLRKHGITIAVDRKVQKDESQFATLMAEFAREQVDVINNFTTPTIWLKMLQQTPSNYAPTYVAVSPVAGYNLIAQALANAGAKAFVFHHFNPAYNEDRPNVAWWPSIQEFMTIFNKYAPQDDRSPRDDFDYNAYLSAKSLHEILLGAGKDLTRTKLWAHLEGLQMNFDPATLPVCPLDFKTNKWLGSKGVNIFRLGTARWEQVATCIDKV